MKLLKWVLCAFLALVILQGTVGFVSAAEARTVRVGAYNNNPKIFKDNNDQPAGVYADLLKYIAQKENWNLVFVWGTWDEGLTRLKNGEIDIMVDVAISPEREKIYDFTKETVMNSWAVIYARKDGQIDSLLDLQGKKISILKSSVYETGDESIEQDLKSFGVKATVVEVDTYRSALDLLELGRVDAAVISYISGLAIQNNYQNIRATKIFLKPTELRFALTKGDRDNPYFVDKLDFWVKKLKGGYDGFYNKTLEKYGLASLETPEEPPLLQQKITQTPCWVLPAGLGAGITLFLVVVMQAFLGWRPIRIFRK